MTEDLLSENIALKEKINELTFELERMEFELRDARRALSKYQQPVELELSVAPLTGIKVVEKQLPTEWPHNDLTQVWGHQDL